MNMHLSSILTPGESGCFAVVRPILLLIALVLGYQFPLLAQDPNYQLRTNLSGGAPAANLIASTGDFLQLEVQADHSGGNVSGWSYGLCHDPFALRLNSFGLGADQATIKLGGPADFDVLTVESGGIRSAVVICFLGCAFLTPASNYHFIDAEYEVIGLAPSTTEISFCDSLGEPPVEVVFVESGQSNIPVTTGSNIQISGPTPVIFEYSAQSLSVDYDPGNGECSFTQALQIREINAGMTPHGASAINMNLQHNGGLLSISQLELSNALAALNGGSGPDFFNSIASSSGLTVQISFADPLNYLEAATATTIVDVEYESVASSLMFNSFGLTTSLDWTLTPGNSANGVEVPGEASGVTERIGASIQLISRESFIRGDANDDGAVDLADALRILAILFNNHEVLCHAASDVNASSAIDIADVIYLLGTLFSMGPAPLAPFPNCGFGAPADLCLNFHSCP